MTLSQVNEIAAPPDSPGIMGLIGMAGNNWRKPANLKRSQEYVKN
jgi:hypothetical protein